MILLYSRSGGEKQAFLKNSFCLLSHAVCTNYPQPPKLHKETFLKSQFFFADIYIFKNKEHLQLLKLHLL